MTAPTRADASKMSIEQLRQLGKNLRGGKDKAAGGARASGPERVEARPEIVPLSFAQEGLWFLEQFARESYDMALVTRMYGARLDEGALQRSIDAIVRRHEVLRTRFPLIDGVGTQQVDPPVPVTIHRLDLSALDEGPRAARARAWLESHEYHLFELRREHAIRVALLRLGDDDHVLVANMHHIASDGWSLRVLLGELKALYEADVEGRVHALAEPKLQYADYALWQRRWLRGEVLQTRLAYWKARLEGAPESLELPTDHPRPPVPSFRGDRERFSLSGDLVRALTRVARQHNMTLFMVLLGAFQLLLSRWSGQTDVVVGSPIAGRGYRDVEDLIGNFVNVLVLRADLAGDPTFTAFLDQVRTTVLGAYEHGDLPFDCLVAELRPSRDMTRQPLFQVAFTYQPGGTRPEDFTIGGMKLEGVPTAHRTSKFDLSLEFFEEADGMQGGVEFATDLFEASTITRLVGHIQTLLAAIAADPARRLSELPLLTPRERAEIETWSATRADYPVTGSIHALFERQVAERPAAVALMHEGRALTYAQLNARANRLAWHLRALGVTRDTLVGVCVERSFDMIVSLLGVLKAGGAYLPLDPAYPTQRLAYMLADSAASVVVTHGSLIDSLSVAGARLARLDADAAEIGACSADDPPAGTRPDDLAYCIYTSGSTGQPKGTLIAHANVLRLLSATYDYFRFGPDDVWSFFHSYAFDFSVWEIFGALSFGGRLVIVPFLCTRSPDAMLELVRANGVTVLNQTPSAFLQLQGALELSATRAPLDSLRAVIFGGEALEPSTLGPWFAIHGDQRPVLANMYGITETTVHVTHRIVRQEDALVAARSPIGRAMPDLQLFVLDASLNQVPVGTPGELYVGGAGLARGYLKRPALTAERFLPNPYARAPGSRLYKTGDRARYRPDGDIDYLGRLDGQVKLRGHRIELGEIEAALREHVAVREAVVAITKTEEMHPRLTCWLVARAGASIDVASVRAYVAERLPQYMVPADFVVLAALPLTENGKIDRAALAAPGPRERTLDVAPVAPRTAAEEALLAIFEGALGLTVGTRDSFFALGGDSILAVKVAHTAAQRGLHVSVTDVFQHQTVSAIAQALAAAGTSVRGPAPLRDLPSPAALGLDAEGPDEDAYPLTTMQALMREAYRRNRETGLGDFHAQQWFRVRDAGASADAMERAIQTLVDRHPVLRTRFVDAPEGPPFQTIRRCDRVAFTTHDVRNLGDAAQRAFVEDLVVTDRARLLPPPDGAHGALRFHWVTLAPDVFVLLMSIHHAIDDGWGNQHFLAWMFDAYERIKAGEVVDTAPVPNVFKEYVALEHEMRGRADAAAFFRDAALPATGKRLLTPIVAQAASHTPVVRRVGGAVASRMIATARRLGTSIKALALSAYIELLEARHDAPLTVGVVTNGRSDRLSDPLTSLGLFWNLLPFSAPFGAAADGQPRPGALEGHAHAVQSALVQVEAYATFPSTRIAELAGADDLFFATFNFVQFHNAFDGDEHPALSFEEGGVHDRFPYPLNIHVSLERADNELFLMLNHDPAYFRREDVEAIADRYLALLLDRLPPAPLG